MPNIKITRYPEGNCGGFSGYIEGETDDGGQWITWFDLKGRPVVHFAHREPSGAVFGPPVLLSGNAA